MFNFYNFEEIKNTPSPSLLYYRNIIQQNIDTAISITKSKNSLWPHIKSHKMPNVIRLSISNGITRFKCATISEAEIAATCGATDVLLAYPIIGPNIKRFLNLRIAFPQTHFYAIGDNIESIYLLSNLQKDCPVHTDLFIDVNLGMNRTGVPLENLEKFIEKCKEIPGISIVGFHCYDGHQTNSDPIIRKKKIHEMSKKLKKILDCIIIKNPNYANIIIGGSPSFPYLVDEWKNDVHYTTYFSPGTVFIYDYGYQKKYPDLPFFPGAAILTRVVSHPNDALFTIDCGYKSIASDPPGPKAFLLGVDNYEECFQSEEHWTFRMKKGYEKERPPIGKELFLLPTHICPTSALYNHAIVIDNKHIVAQWPVTARNRFLLY